MKRELLDDLQRRRASHRPCVVLTHLDDGQQRLVGAEEPGLSEAVALTVARALERDKSSTVQVDGRDVFVQPFNPPLRLLVIGAVHVTQALIGMATACDYAVTVIDPRESFARASRFPGVEVVCDWPDDALARLEPDTRTAIVTLTHDPKIDDPALEVALRSPAFYVGALGSKKTHAARVERLEGAGLSPEEIDGLHAPVGLPIGSRSPGEIAVSVLAQITQRLRRGDA